MDAWIEVDRQELESVLKSLGRILKGTPHDRASIAYEGGHLVMQCGGAAMSTPAEGDWAGRALLRGQALLGISSLFPAEEIVRLEVDQGKIRIGSLGLPCEWSARSAPSVEIPLNPPLPYLLAIERQFSARDIRDSGLERIIEEAVETRDQLILRAAEALAELGVSREALADLVNSTLPDIALDADLSALLPAQSGLELLVDGDQLELGD
jgi:hypothetical protein